MNTVIKAESLGKKYILHHEQPERYTALRDVIARTAKGVALSVVSPFLRRQSNNGNNGKREDLWALRDVSFEVKQGETVGIIGRNGAGKSTLLKILSRITEPTEGRVSLKGRVASLLEVGTGFHPELTGRENIYLNGAILGMTKAEIKGKFDEIVDFAEIEKFLDTPVKRYSSGMYMRLAFSVAAHLEPEILLVDEVLAVGDAEFQKKCLGRMGRIAVEGRTVLFVSHNMSAISELCGRALWLQSGKIWLDGSPSDVITAYVISGNYHAQVDLASLSHYGPQQYARLTRVSLMDEDRRLSTSFFMNKPLIAQIEIECHRLMKNAEVGLKISSRQGTAIHYLTSTWEGLRGDLEPGRHLFEVTLPRLLLFPGKYQVGVWTLREGETSDDNVQEATYFEVVKGEVTEYPTTIEKYCFSGCEVFASSSWNLVKHAGGTE